MKLHLVAISGNSYKVRILLSLLKVPHERVFVDTRNRAHKQLLFLKQLVKRSRRKLFLILDDGPCHNLTEGGKAWLGRNHHRIALFRLPPYSPNFNPTEDAWKQTKKFTTHNRFFHTTDERDAALVLTFERFQSNPSLLAGHVARFL